MKIGASYWMFEGGLEASLPVADAIAQAKDLGFDAIELCIASSGVLTHEATQADCERIVATAGELGIEIAGVASGESWGCSPTDDDPAVRAKIVAFTKRALQVAKWLGTDAYLFVPGAVDVFFLEDSPVVPYDVCYERARHAVEQLVPTAEELGVKLGIENVWNKFLLSPLEMRDFIDSFGSAAVGSYFDAGNVLLTGYPEHWISILAQRIVRVHVKDFKKSVGTAAGFVDMLEGDVDFQAVRTALERIGYDGYVTAEMLPYEPGRPEKTAAAMKKLFK
ncbi:MAG: sugar phosphate isomerase/epimerase [Pirellulales bacterium]|jgi:hexulose-6-phosphate isomerase|nr:sugar phosphate isomerase/epimerase [Thermoguttaceae bacterium]MDD4788467.1 sugar phosphate isomerase/epimerase [Pirellulales bacterium]MDI9442973.1 sugar phosphate isomerase/epimerase family protein [Planctomycetota bacterium]NLZ01903.1 sugar phosphate isomerase/epimerase [Pirellulaceae bacterium]